MTHKPVPKSARAFAPIEDATLKAMAELNPNKFVPAGTTLCEQGGYPESVYLVKSGIVKLLYITEDGTQKLLGLRSSGWMAGAAHVLTKTISTTSIVTATRCSVYAIAVDSFNDWLRAHPQLNENLLCIFALEIVSTREQMKQFMASSAEDRLRQYLKEHEQAPTHTGPYQMKQSEVAQLLDMSPEHLSRLQRKMHLEKGRLDLQE